MTRAREGRRRRSAAPSRAISAAGPLVYARRAAPATAMRAARWGRAAVAFSAAAPTFARRMRSVSRAKSASTHCAGFRPPINPALRVLPAPRRLHDRRQDAPARSRDPRPNAVPVRSAGTSIAKPPDRNADRTTTVARERCVLEASAERYDSMRPRNGHHRGGAFVGPAPASCRSGRDGASVHESSHQRRPSPKGSSWPAGAFSSSFPARLQQNIEPDASLSAYRLGGLLCLIRGLRFARGG